MDAAKLLLIICLVILVLILYVRFVTKAKKKEEDEEIQEMLDKDPPLKPLLFTSGSEKKPTQGSVVKKEEVTKMVAQKSLDRIYAEDHQKWVCNYCETINENGAHRCAACGKNTN